METHSDQRRAVTVFGASLTTIAIDVSSTGAGSSSSSNRNAKLLGDNATFMAQAHETMPDGLFPLISHEFLCAKLQLGGTRRGFMLAISRSVWSAVACMIVLSTASTLEAGWCPQQVWTLNEIADVPVLLVARVVSLNMEDGPHFAGDPKSSAPAQRMTAEVKVLRSFGPATVTGGAAPERLKIRFLGRDGPDFGFCAQQLPMLEPGQVLLLLPLRSHAKESSEPWQFAGIDGYGMTTRVAEKMRASAAAPNDPRSFIIRELVNSFSRGDPIARFTAASLVAREDDYLEPDLTNQLQRSIGSDISRWAQVLGNLLLQYPNQGLTVSAVLDGNAEVDRAHFKALPLARLALSRIPGRALAETLVWRALLADVPGFADQPYHPLFAYDSSPALSASVNYLSRYAGGPEFLEGVKAALRQDRPGSSAVAAGLIDHGQKACLPEALDRAMKVIGRPAANGSDVFAAIMLILNEGSDDQRRQYLATASRVRSINPDYAAFLQLKLNQTPKDHR
jgi:hypothetical protein